MPCASWRILRVDHGADKVIDGDTHCSLSLLPDSPDGPLEFLSYDEVDARAETFERTGFVGSVNRYRAGVGKEIAADTIVDVAGRWVQQEASDILDAALAAFLGSL